MAPKISPGAPTIAQSPIRAAQTSPSMAVARPPAASWASIVSSHEM